MGAASLFHAPLVGGCSGGSGEGDGSAGAGGGDAGGDATPFEPPVFDPDTPWWLQHNYAAVEEREALELEVEGAIPPELDGLYARNGSNPRRGEAQHWFLGDGMVHGVRLQGGKALWYRNRYVRTTMYEQNVGYGATPPTGPDNTSNVSIVHHAGRLLTTGEAGFPYEISPEDLSTVGPYDFDGKLTTWFAAHPKLDPITGELLAFGYFFAPPYVTYHRIDASGAIVPSEPIDLPGPVMMDDFQATATRIVFMDLPVAFDTELLAAGEVLAFAWKPSLGARLGVMPRTGTNADVRWFDIDPCYVFHTLNAYDDPDRPDVVVLEGARHPTMWASHPHDFTSEPRLHRWKIDLAGGTVSEQQIDDHLTEFVKLDPRVVGREHRYGYGVWGTKSTDPAGRPGRFGGILKRDLQTGTTTQQELSAELETGEAVFIPAAPDAGEDDGYLMSFVYDAAADRSELWILDASHVEAAPMARVKLPFRVPYAVPRVVGADGLSAERR